MSGKKHLTEALRDSGYRVTAARRDICATLVNSGGHMSPDELVEAVRRHNPGVGRMTVYRTLDILCELGQVRPIYRDSGAALYVVLENGHHHHLVCSQCGRFFEFGDCTVEALLKMVSERFDFVVDGHLLELYGRCADCRETE